VKINDRGPYIKTIDWDFSKQAAIDLDYIKKGIQRVRVDILKTKYSNLLQK
jgi:rare lipoprotein A (peptidoglycan hydrolase)